MAARCAGYWLQIMKKHNVVPVWSEKYMIKSSTTSRVESTSESDNDDDDDDELDKHEDSFRFGRLRC
jgi:hypothetical protein